MTTAIRSPRFEANVALAMMDKGCWQAGTVVTVESSDGLKRSGVITELPMED